MNRSTPDPLFQKLALFSQLRPDQLRAIERISSVKNYGTGEILFYEGDEARCFHFLVEGEVTVFKTSASTDTIAVHRFRAPSFVAEMAALKQIPYPASAECTRPSVVIQIDRDPFLELLGDDPALSIAFIASLTQKISVLEASLRRLSASSASAKVARMILDEGELFNRLKGIEAARLLGITPETLSRTLKKFKAHSLISHSPSQGIRVIDFEKLKAVADNDFPLR